MKKTGSGGECKYRGYCEDNLRITPESSELHRKATLEMSHTQRMHQGRE